MTQARPAGLPAREAVDATVATIWRLESPRIVAALSRTTRDLGLAEELAQDALIAALEHWPTAGLPDKPAAWLMATAQRRALDHLRHRKMSERHGEALAADQAALGADVAPDVADEVAARQANDLDDDARPLMLVACHPRLSPDARAALTLKVVAGLGTAEIARALSGVGGHRGAAPGARPAHAGRGEGDLRGATRCAARAAARFGAGGRVSRLQRGLRGPQRRRLDAPAAGARGAAPGARTGNSGTRRARGAGPAGLAGTAGLAHARPPRRRRPPVLLEQQDRGRWDRLLLRRGLGALQAAEAAAGAQGRAAGPCVLQAAIAAEHARAARVDDTDWPAIVRACDRLLAVMPSPVVRLNRAVAVSRASGAAAALPLIDALQAEPALAAYPWLPAVQGDLLSQLGRAAEARAVALAAPR